MGLIGGSREDASRSVNRREHSAWTRLLAPGEQIHELHRLPRTTLLFTSRRLVHVEEALTGRKVDYLSIPYRSITHFGVEASGAFSADSDLRIWVAGRTAPVEKSFGPEVDVYAVQALLAQHVTA